MIDCVPWPSSNNNKLFGESGNDLIVASTAPDPGGGPTAPAGGTAFGGSGNDTLRAGKGGSVLYGEVGKDTLKGSSDNDKLNGGPGKDLCKGGKGNDTASKCEVKRSI